ncbi:MAG: sigma-54 dependent transcriptional regulator [Prevotellaceae bacterium]|jgi:two-component system response regulator HydG|nr:sigma-54 dependent transcriptional regulator [Prevotellaceae bacterium]
MKKVLIVEDEVSFCVMLKTWFEKNHWEADSAFSAGEAMTRIKANAYPVILSDLRLPDNDGISLLQWIKQTSPQSEVLIMTHYADVQTAVAAIKLGAFDYLEKPVNPDVLQQKLAEVLRKQTKNTKSAVSEHKIPYIVGHSAASKKLDEYIHLVAPTAMSVLITGESGTGKEYAARCIHENSPRHAAPFVALDCGAITKELGASELFGHVKGAFTSAIDNKTGVFEYADGGTLFLDEIGNLSSGVQMQLLRALQERIIKPVGSNREIAVDVRVVAATNENLWTAIADGKFRRDLFHRINEFSMHMPPLRERGEDLFLFARVFLAHANRDLSRQVIDFNEKAKAVMAAYSWPGNLRELKNVVKRAVLLCASDYIGSSELPNELTIAAVPPFEIIPLKRPDERELILDTLARNSYNKSKTAKALGIDRKTLYNKMEKYGIR